MDFMQPEMEKGIYMIFDQGSVVPDWDALDPKGNHGVPLGPPWLQDEPRTEATFEKLETYYMSDHTDNHNEYSIRTLIQGAVGTRRVSTLAPISMFLCYFYLKF